ncbi:YoeB-YefM toxin-antitoxin system antitoxin YefM [Arsenophonus apicola]|uniref:YoeB-YefM toxin-antitoxin system antitoxin YefM n=2 Tax=Morganellaceae TaxID=1903414 RepID=UPI00387A7ED0
MKTVNYTDARQNLTSIMNEAIDDRIPILITRQKGIPCVLLSLDEYQSLEETAYLLRSPANARHLLDSIDELNAGKGIERDIQEGINFYRTILERLPLLAADR